MTLDEAIHEQQLHLDGDPTLKDIRLRQSMHLGIEALKRILQERKIENDPDWGHLWSETQV